MHVLRDEYLEKKKRFQETKNAMRIDSLLIQIFVWIKSR